MLLTIDIGNTNITIGAYAHDKLCFVSRLATDKERTQDQYAIELANAFTLYQVQHGAFTGAIISSVVPELTASIAKAVTNITDCEPKILGPQLQTGLEILTDTPTQVGSDLIAGAVAAAALYPLPCLVIDLGTATKISALDENGAFRGCAIAPGVMISIKALSSRTSQLPSISLDVPRRAIGKNTVDSMQAGVVFGTAAMLDGLCDKMEAELHRPVQTVVATGGLSQDIIKSCKRKILHNGELLLFGLKLIYDKTCRQ